MLASRTEAQLALPTLIQNAGLELLPIAPPDIRQEKVRYGELRQAVFWSFDDVLHLLRVRRWKTDYEPHNTFARTEELPYLESATLAEVTNAVEAAMSEIVPGNLGLITKAVALADSLKEANDTIALLRGLTAMYDLHQEIFQVLAEEDSTNGLEVQGFFSPPCTTQMINIQPSPQTHQGHVLIYFPSKFGQNLMEAVQSNVRWLRDEDRRPTFFEFVVEHVAYVFLATGKQLSSLSFANEAQFLGTVGFRPVTQTYPSLTDPGDGHVFGTTRKQRWMNGAIVHVEHLERPGGVPRTMIESYRIPAILDFARTRLHTAGAMPNTYFTGRALRDSEGTFQQSFIKVVNTTSAACSQAFSLGAAECKIAMDNLTTTQMIAYLKALAGHALRGPHQYFSCAFNLNSPIVDDRCPEGEICEPRTITDRFEIAKLGIEVATAGGFDKVTWDGASNSYPSKCIIHQLSFEEWLFLAHHAHECGLTTYASAGFKFPQIRFGVWAGIDGLGIGGAQILRHMDHETGMHGPYTEENLDRVLKARDVAAEDVRGRGVALLARLDRMSFEGTLTEAEDELRGEFFNCLAKADETLIEDMLNRPELQEIKSMADDGQRPYTAWSQRLLRRHYLGDKIILQTFATVAEWNTLIAQLSIALGRFAPTIDASYKVVMPPLAKTAPLEVELDALDVHVGIIWTHLRILKAERTLQGHALSRLDNVVKVKTTPFSTNAEARRSAGSSAQSSAPSSGGQVSPVVSPVVSPEA